MHHFVTVDFENPLRGSAFYSLLDVFFFVVAESKKLG
jgi:hypothetical protein